MTYIFMLAHAGLILMSGVGIISSVTDWGDFLHTGLGPVAWGLIALMSAVLATAAHAFTHASTTDRTWGITEVLIGVTFLLHMSAAIYAIPVAIMAVLYMLAGGFSVEAALSIITAAILSIFMTPFGEVIFEIASDG